MLMDGCGSRRILRDLAAVLGTTTPPTTPHAIQNPARATDTRQHPPTFIQNHYNPSGMMSNTLKNIFQWNQMVTGANRWIF